MDARPFLLSTGHSSGSFTGDSTGVVTLLRYLRSDRKPARTSSEKSFGCSHAAKCPPFFSLLQWISLG